MTRLLPVASGAKGGSGPVLVPRPRAVYLVGVRAGVAVLGVEVVREAVLELGLVREAVLGLELVWDCCWCGCGVGVGVGVGVGLGVHPSPKPRPTPRLWCE